MGKKVMICGTEYEMACSVLTLANFKNYFGMDADFGQTHQKVIDVFNQINEITPKSLTKEQLEKLSESEKKERDLAYLEISSLFYSIIVDVCQMAYAMIKECDINFMPYQEWFRTLTNVMEDAKWMKEVVGIASTVFRGKLQAKDQDNKQQA